MGSGVIFFKRCPTEKTYPQGRAKTLNGAFDVFTIIITWQFHPCLCPIIAIFRPAGRLSGPGWVTESVVQPRLLYETLNLEHSLLARWVRSSGLLSARSSACSIKQSTVGTIAEAPAAWLRTAVTRRTTTKSYRDRDSNLRPHHKRDHKLLLSIQKSSRRSDVYHHHQHVKRGIFLKRVALNPGKPKRAHPAMCVRIDLTCYPIARAVIKPLVLTLIVHWLTPVRAWDFFEPRKWAHNTTPPCVRRLLPTFSFLALGAFCWDSVFLRRSPQKDKKSVSGVRLRTPRLPAPSRANASMRGLSNCRGGRLSVPGNRNRSSWPGVQYKQYKNYPAALTKTGIVAKKPHQDLNLFFPSFRFLEILYKK